MTDNENPNACAAGGVDRMEHGSASHRPRGTGARAESLRGILDEAILTPADVARRWHVHEVTVQRLCKQNVGTGDWLGFRVGRLWRIPLSRVERHEANAALVLDERKIVDLPGTGR